MDDVTVYVPAPGSIALQHVARRSGIVGWVEGERAQVYFEGNLYHRPGLARFADRVYQAASRRAAAYETIAQAVVAPEELVAVGVFDGFEGEVQLDEDHRDTLAEWLDMASVPANELIATVRHFQDLRDCRRLLASDDPAERTRGLALQRRHRIQIVRRPET